jgi:HPt (histidine-containing phosphotransfer) domain-containing protein
VTAPIDMPALARDFAGDTATIHRLLGIFLKDALRYRVALREAAAAGDAEAVYRIAHALTGNLGVLRAQEAHADARSVEQAARDGAIDRESVGRLDTAIGGVVAFIHEQVGSSAQG